jgi:glycosyltransferase involved in cell wall biosynthesis
VIAAADVIAAPSLAEGLGVAAIEAMAAGRAVVASAVGGLTESVRDGIEGLLVAPGDVAGLARAIERCLLDETLRRRFGEAGRLRAEQYTTLAMARRTESVYERALARRDATREQGVE